MKFELCFFHKPACLKWPDMTGFGNLWLLWYPLVIANFTIFLPVGSGSEKIMFGPQRCLEEGNLY